jgi:hypothetical protein
MIDQPASEGLIILLNALYAVLATRSDSNLKAAKILIEKISSFPDDPSYPSIKIQKMITAANSEIMVHYLKDKLSSFHRRFGHGE